MDESFHIDGPALERFRRYLYLLACTHIDSGLRAKIEPSDLVEQTLLEAVTNREQFRGNGDAELAGWLRQILANNLADALRHFDLLPDISGPTPIDHAVNDEQLTHLPDALDQLPESQRDAIVLHHLQGLSLADTAQRLGKTQPSVAGLLHRGLIKLRQLLERKVD